MHFWSWAFFQNYQKSTIPKTSNVAKRPHFFSLDLILSHHTRVLSSISWPIISFSILFDFYWFNSFLINLNQNKIQILIAWYLFDHYSFQLTWYTQSNSYQALLCTKYLIWDIFGSLLMEDHIKSWFINSHGFKPKFLT